MQEIKYKEIIVQAENGRPLLLSYLVLSDKSQALERYGVKVVEERSGEAAQVADLTVDPKRICALVDKLAEHTVTPTTLADIVADWL